MSIHDFFNKINKNINLLKNVVIFMVNICKLLPPFRQILRLVKILENKIKGV